MKKITFLVALLITSLSQAQFLEDFNSAAFPPTGWAVFNGANGLGTVEQWEQAGTAPEFRAQCIWEDVSPDTALAEDWIVSPLIPINSMQNILQFDATDLNQGAFGSVLSVRVSTTSQTNTASFTEIDSFTEAELGNNPSAVFSSFSIGLNSFTGQSVYIAFVHVQNDGDAVTIDNVEVVQGATSPPNPTTSPTPTDMATGVIVDVSDANMDGTNDNSVTFAWMDTVVPGAPGVDDYEIFLGDSPTTLVSLGATPNQTVDITGLFYNTTYFWQAVARNGAGSAANSPVWRFTTEMGNVSAPPVVTGLIPSDMATVGLDISDQDMDGNPDNAVGFEWTLPTTGDSIEAVVFNLGTTPTDQSAFVSNRGTTAETLRLSGLADNTTYYWRVDLRNVGGVTTGPVFEFTTDSTASVGDVKPVNALSIFPNPVENILSLQGISNISAAKIFNALGQEVMNINELSEKQIDVSSLSDGVYMLQVDNGTINQTVRFIKE